jgi:hypothetical protein
MSPRWSQPISLEWHATEEMVNTIIVPLWKPFEKVPFLKLGTRLYKKWNWHTRHTVNTRSVLVSYVWKTADLFQRKTQGSQNTITTHT